MSIHLQGVTPGSLGEATLLVGDPGRIPLVTDHWQNVTELCRNREFVVCSGTYEDKLFSVCSTGIGLGSTEIAVMELIENGAQAFVRVGGCGSWREDIPAGALLFFYTRTSTTIIPPRPILCYGMLCIRKLVGKKSNPFTVSALRRARTISVRAALSPGPKLLRKAS